MKNLTIASFVFLAGCANMQMRYVADVDTENGPAHYVFEKSYKTIGYAWACGATAIFYGGWCWMYNTKPDGYERKLLIQEAMENLRSEYHLAAVSVRIGTVWRLDWEELPQSSNLIYYSTQPIIKSENSP